MEVIPKSSSYHVPYFILSVSIAELVAFLYEVVRLKNDSCIDVDAAGPPPLCSPLIYNPYREIRRDVCSVIHRSKLHEFQPSNRTKMASNLNTQNR